MAECIAFQGRTPTFFLGIGERWALWLLEQHGTAPAVDRVSHVDQLSFCLAIHDLGLPFERAQSNVNYYVHFAGHHKYLMRLGQSHCCTTITAP